MHLLWSGWLGYRIGRRRAGAGGLVRSTVAGFFIASFLHGLWDALCFAGLVGVLFLLFGGQLVAFGWHIRKMTWLCANRSPRRPDPVLEAQSAARTPSPGFRCGTCGVPYESVSLRGAVILACPGCPAAAAGRGDLFRFVNEYSGSRGWFTPDAWYRYYWREPEPEGSLPCPGCGARLRARRFLHEEGPRVGFCDDCALSVGDRGDLFGLVERFRSRLENGFLHG
jgi:Zn-finger nucleic acid-binding protein